MPHEISIPGHEILHVVGEGGMARVHAGARLGVGRSIKPVAIKVIRERFAADPRFREMFLGEGRIAMKLTHCNIVSVFDVGEAGDDLYMIMDWIDGVTLDRFAHALMTKRQQEIELPVIITIVTQLLCGLHHAHTYQINREKVGIVHRDVSPFNVMVSSSGEIKLMDFGVARIAGGRTTKNFKGNLAFMPKEQAQGDPRVESDLYAVGGILFGLLEGQGFRSHCKTEDELLQAIWSGTVPELRRASLPEELRRLVRELLAPDWRDRPHSAAEVIRRLERLPIEQFTSLLPMQELYLEFCGESHSRLTQFVHRDPKVWVENMRKRGQAAPPEAPREDRGPCTRVQPRKHEVARLHRVKEADDAPFDETRTAVYLPKGEQVEEDEDDPREGPTSKVTVRFSLGDTAEEGPEHAPVLPATVRLAPIEGTRAEAAEPPELVERTIAELRLPPRPGLFTRFGWVSRTFGGRSTQGKERWRELFVGPLGILVLSCIVFGVMVPIACVLGQAEATELRR